VVFGRETKKWAGMAVRCKKCPAPSRQCRGYPSALAKSAVGDRIGGVEGCSASLAAESIAETGRTVHEPRAPADLIRICTGALGEPNSAEPSNFDWSNHGTANK
jgi:hypothetical protein